MVHRLLTKNQLFSFSEFKTEIITTNCYVAAQKIIEKNVDFKFIFYVHYKITEEIRENVLFFIM